LVENWFVFFPASGTLFTCSSSRPYVEVLAVAGTLVLPQGASRVLLLRSDERHSIPQLSSPRFGQPASLAWRLFEVQRFWRSLAHADLSVLTRENRGGKPDFQLRVAPAWSHFLVHHHLSREWF